MAAPAVPPLTLDDLDRDELLAFLRKKCLPFTARDLLSARWDVAVERWRAALDLDRAASARTQVALEAYYTLPQTPCAAGKRATAWRDYREAQAAEERQERKTKRLERIQNAAWKALEATWAKVPA